MSAKTLVERLDRRGGAVELLWPLAGLFGALSGLRGWMYGRGILGSQSAQVPVICVGNIVAGGTGKTPMVVHLARLLETAGWKPGILSRGYGKDGAAGATSDEARLYAELLGDLPRVALPDRVEGARRLREMGATVVVMDDGFQHRRLARDLDLVLVDCMAPFGLANGPRAFLPRGLLRESPRALGRGAALVLTRSDQVDAGALNDLERDLENYAPGVPRLLARHGPVGLRVLGAAGADLALEDLAGLEVDVVSAIGNPAAFEATVAGLGARIVGSQRFEDHHEYIGSDLKGLGEQRPLLTTAKDAVKLRDVLEKWDSVAQAGVYAVDVELCIERGNAVLGALLESRLGQPGGSSAGG